MHCLCSVKLCSIDCSEQQANGQTGNSSSERRQSTVTTIDEQTDPSTDPSINQPVDDAVYVPMHTPVSVYETADVDVNNIYLDPIPLYSN